ncbi:MAG: hypothetical protein AAF236_08255 [Verrucomicrobiota bacterium]
MSFSDPRIIERLQREFVPVAIDQAYQRRQKDAEGRFYQKIANQGPRQVGNGGPTTQGHYLAAPDGTFLTYGNHRDPEHLLERLDEALTAYQPTATAAIEPGKLDPKWNPAPPEGGLVLRVHSRILDGYAEPTTTRAAVFSEAIGRDNAWVRAEEHASLLAGTFPDSLARRLARFHFVDNTRGEPSMWDKSEVKDLSIELNTGKVTGTFSLETSDQRRRYVGDLIGYIESDQDRITRFELAVKGQFRGEGQYTRGAPEGDFPLALFIELATGEDPADAIPPQGSRGWIENYW